MTEKLNHDAVSQPVAEHGRRKLKDSIKRIGKMLIGADLTPDSERAPLPEGYHYADARWLKPTELGNLWRQVKGHEDTSRNFGQYRRASARYDDATLIEVAVRDKDGGLSGYGSALWKGDEGEMRNFVVNGADQGKGIGKAIILERIRIADEFGVPALRVPEVLETNTLVPFYLEQGFVEQSNGDLLRALPQHDTQA